MGSAGGQVVPATRDRERHRAEFDFIVASGIFSPRSNPARFLEYVCTKYFEGQEAVSEYDIAVEVFNRRDFDPQKDSIVRVEAHRVRKRLSKFYQEEGAGRKCRLVIPQGGYLPVFSEEEAEAPPAAVSPPDAFPTRIPPRSLHRVIVVLVVILLGALAAALLVRSKDRTPKPATIGAPGGKDVATSMAEVRIMAGASGGDYTDRLGRIWSADRFYEGGDTLRARYRRILRTTDTLLFLNYRQGDFGYNIPLQPGLYELRLYFAETFIGEDNQDGGGESSRMFNVLANGVPLLTYFDPLSDAGGSNTVTVRVFTAISPAADGKLHLRFKPSFSGKAPAFVNAIEVIRTKSKAMLPIRWVASAAAEMDSLSQIWQPDQFSYGGRLRVDTETVTGTADAELYRSERYGHFSYAVPVAREGTYTLTLHFAEHWFGIENRDNKGGRSFDVFCNGVALLRGFDIVPEAGGSLKAVKKTFRGLKPNAQGKLLLTFVPIHDYATIGALEVLDERAR